MGPSLMRDLDGAFTDEVWVLDGAFNDEVWAGAGARGAGGAPLGA